MSTRSFHRTAPVRIPNQTSPFGEGRTVIPKSGIVTGFDERPSKSLARFMDVTQSLPSAARAIAPTRISLSPVEASSWVNRSPSERTR